MSRGRGGIGDGDACPVDRTHGYMLILKSATGRQYCPHISHSAHGKERPPTRCFWPVGWRSFESAESEYHATTEAAVRLPDLDITLEV